MTLDSLHPLISETELYWSRYYAHEARLRTNLTVQRYNQLLKMDAGTKDQHRELRSMEGGLDDLAIRWVEVVTLIPPVELAMRTRQKRSASLVSPADSWSLRLVFPPSKHPSPSLQLPSRCDG